MSEWVVCRECSGPIRTTQEGAGAHRYASDTWLCETCWLQVFDDSPDNTQDYHGPRCECCRFDIAPWVGLDGYFRRLEQRSEWVRQAQAHLANTGTVEASDDLHDRIAALLQAIENIDLETGGDLAHGHEITAFDAAQELCNRAQYQAAGVKGSRASVETYEEALGIIAGQARVERQYPQHKTLSEIVTRVSAAEEDVRHYWRVQGLEPAAAETAAALDIANARAK
jgi:hypothetical protein